MLIQREIREKIENTSVGFPVVSITGARQTGKTTISKEIFNEYFYTNLEEITQREFAEQDPKAFLNQSDKMIIDEIQRVPELFSYIQVIVDENKEKRFIITGSQNFKISEKISQSLAGRVAIYTLPPLTNSELNNSRIKIEDIDTRMLKGSYPRIYSSEVDTATWYRSYINTYLEKDVREIKNIGDLSQFTNFLKLLAGRTGQVMNYSSLADDTGVSVPTIQNWISVLETSYIIFKLQPYSRNFNKRIIKAPKIHFYDTLNSRIKCNGRTE